MIMSKKWFDILRSSNQIHLWITNASPSTCLRLQSRLDYVWNQEWSANYSNYSTLSPFVASQVAMHFSNPGLLFTTTTTSLLSSIKSSSTYISYLTANIFQSPFPTLHYNVHLSPVAASLLDFVVAPHDSLPLLLPCKYVCCPDNMSWIQCILHTTRKLNIIYMFSNAPTFESVCQNHPAKSSSTFASSIAVIINIIIIIAEQEIIIHIYPPALSNTIILPGRIKPTSTISYSYPSQQVLYRCPSSSTDPPSHIISTPSRK